MKNLLVVVVVSLVAGVASFSLMRSHKLASNATNGGPLVDTLPELAWVRTELKLTDSQFAKVSELHVAYRPKCLELCQNIAAAHEKLARLTTSDRKVTPELEAAIREHAEVHANCQQAMLRHLYETAATLDEKQANRYLELMIPYALDAPPSDQESNHCH
jgi:DNA-binding SARP family transcriptional activator